MEDRKIWDVIIIGGGPAGLTAGIYASRAKREVLILERLAAGGLIALTDMIDNYPGFKDGIAGYELAQAMEAQALKFGVNIERTSVEKLEVDGDLKIAHTDKGEFHAKTIVIASGTQPRRLNVPGESKLFGRGVSTCATCDGPFFRNRVIGVVGGGDSAIQESIYLSRFAKEIHLIHRRDQLRAVKDLQQKVFAVPNIKFHWNRIVVSIQGEQQVEGVILKDTITGETERLELNGLFIFTGFVPNTEFLVDLPIATDERGCIVTNENMETNVPGIYAAGDVRSKTLWQIVTAVADGAVAAFDLEKYLG